MTGRIEMLATAISAGRITSNTGANTFHYAYRIPLGNTDGLSVGGLVTFQLERGNPNVAISVCADQGSAAEAAGTRRPEVRYQGFEQTNDVRSFKFQAWRTGEENQQAVVTADLALFRKHGVTIQEGPGLCLRLVEVELQQASPSQDGVWKRALTDKEILEHVACRRQSGRRG